MPPGLMGFSQGDDQSGRLFFSHQVIWLLKQPVGKF